MDAEEKAKLEEMTSDFIQALKFGNIDSVMEFFHPDRRGDFEEMLRDGGLEGTVQDLPEGDPEFEWKQASDGTPLINVANSKAEWGMGWACIFRDGRWWLD